MNEAVARNAVGAALRYIAGGQPAHLSVRRNATVYRGNPRCPFERRAFPDPDGFFMPWRAQTMLAHLAMPGRCMELVEEAEKRRGGDQYDWVVRARPDLVWLRPIDPYCFFGQAATHVYRKRDFVWLIPRSLAYKVLRAAHREYYRCREPQTMPGRQSSEGFWQTLSEAGCACGRGLLFRQSWRD